MKTAALILLGLCVSLRVDAGEPPAKKGVEPAPGTRTYQVALFKRGPKWGKDPGEAKELQAERLQYLARLEREGKIVLAGPFTDRGLYHSMIVFRADSMEAAKALIAEMPSIKAERLVYEIHPWLSADGIRIIQPRPGQPSPTAKPAPKKTDSSKAASPNPAAKKDEPKKD